MGYVETLRDPNLRTRSPCACRIALERNRNPGIVGVLCSRDEGTLGDHAGEQIAGDGEQRVGSKEQGARSKEQGARSKEQGVPCLTAIRDPPFAIRYSQSAISHQPS